MTHNPLFLKSILRSRILRRFLEEARSHDFDCFEFNQFLVYINTIPHSDKNRFSLDVKKLKHNFEPTVNTFLINLNIYCIDITSPHIDSIDALCRALSSPSI